MRRAIRNLPPFAFVERLVNSLVKSELDDPASLHVLNDRSLRFVMRDTPFSLVIRVVESNLQLSKGLDTEVDVTITGTTSAFLRLARSHDKAGDLLEGDMQIEGNLDVALMFSKVFSKVDIDWEEHVASVFGDTLARGITLTVGGLLRWQRDTVKTLWQNLADYLAYESSLLADAQEVQKFCADVNIFRNDVERTAARLAALTGKPR